MRGSRFATWEEADEAGHFLRPRGGWPASASRWRLRSRRQALSTRFGAPRSAFSRHTGQTETTTRTPSVGVRTPPEHVWGMEGSCDMVGQSAEPPEGR